MIAIIAGQAKGRRLKTLEGQSTRPTTGKVRAALFNTLQAWVAGAAWLDLYAGSGAVGLESASRGASRVVLVERAPQALAVIRENLALARLTGLELLASEVPVALRRLSGQVFDVVFLDPPYDDDPLPVLHAIAEGGLLAPDGRLVVEHRSSREMPEAIAGLTCVKRARYAESALSYYAHEKSQGG